MLREERARSGRQGGEASVSGIDMQPEIVAAGESGQLADGVEGAGGGGAGVGHYAKRAIAGGQVLLHQPIEGGEIDLHLRVGGNAAHVGFADAEHPGRFADGKVAFGGNVGAHAPGRRHAVAHHVAGGFGAAGGGQGGEVGHGSAAHQQAAGLRGIAQDLLHPVDGDVLQVRGGRPGSPAGDVDVEGRGEHGSHGGDRRSGRRDVAEESRVGAVAAVAGDHVVESLQERIEIHAVLRQRLFQQVAQGSRCGGNQYGPFVQGVVIGRDLFHGGAPQRPDLLGRKD